MDVIVRDMITALETSDLEVLLDFAGMMLSPTPTPRPLLLARALSLIQTMSPFPHPSCVIVDKVRELYGSRMKIYYPFSDDSQSENHPRPPTKSITCQVGEKIGRNFDANMKELPFFEVLSSQVHKLPNQKVNQICTATLVVYLTPRQASAISSSASLLPSVSPTSVPNVHYQVQLQLRFCQDLPIENKSDVLPAELSITCNGKAVPRPKSAGPLDITNLVRMSPVVSNSICIEWKCSTDSDDYCIVLSIVKRLSVDNLLDKLKSRTLLQPEWTCSQIRSILDGTIAAKRQNQDIIAPTSLRVSTICPIGRVPMSYPCRTTICSHVQCFDAQMFLTLNEFVTVWTCPICKCPINFEDLWIDSYFLRLVPNNFDRDGETELNLFPDGTWGIAKVVDKRKRTTESPILVDLEFAE